MKKVLYTKNNIIILAICLSVIFFLFLNNNYSVNESFDNFKGERWRSLKPWHKYVKLNPHSPLNYLEIGSHSGGSVIDFNNEYGKNPETKLYCIDPWTDYDDYFEYKGKTTKIFEDFKKNIKNANIEEKVIILRGFSHDKIHDLSDNFFDVIYIDGNHEPQFVLEDAVIAFRKLKMGGYMVFDDVGWGGPKCVSVGIKAFMNGFKNSIQILSKDHNGQAFIKKIKKTNPCRF